MSQAQGALSYELRCQECGDMTMNLDDWRARISVAWEKRRGQVDISRP